jgi:hypothetical protein
MDPPSDPLTTRPIQMGWDIIMEPYLSGQFGFIDDPDRQFVDGSVWTRTGTGSDGPEPLLTLGLVEFPCECANRYLAHTLCWFRILWVV